MPTGIYKRTAKHKKKISDALKGKMPKYIPNRKGTKCPKELYPDYGMRNKKHSEETKKKMGISHKGRVLSKEWKEKISKSLKNRVGKPVSEEAKKIISKKIKLFYKNCDDDFKKERSKKISEALKGRKKPPRSEEHRKKISEAHKGKTAWNKGEHLSEEKLKEMRDKVYSNPERNKKISETLRGVPRPSRQGIMPKNLQYPGRYRNGYYNINGKRVYFRSKWEANYALYLDFLIKQKQIKKWTYEKDVFIFEKIKFGTRSYRPDFKIYNNDESIEYHEVKGYMDAKSKTKIKRMAKYYPNIKLIIVDKPIYKDIKKKLGKMLKFY